LETEIIQVPYDSGHKDAGMGKGPSHLVRYGLGSFPPVRIEQVEVEELPFEMGTTFRVLRSLAEKVASAIQSSRFPLVLAGGCTSCIGTLAGMDARSSAVVWLDGHADFNTPETTVSGFVDGMALAMAAGRCWREMTAAIPRFHPIAEERIILLGARDIDPKERSLLAGSGVQWIDAQASGKRGVQDALGGALENLQAEQIYLHIDLDVLDVSEARVNRFSSAGGLTLAELVEVVKVIAGAGRVAAAAITAYDPSCDTDGAALLAGTAVIKQLTAINHENFARACG